MKNFSKDFAKSTSDTWCYPRGGEQELFRYFPKNSNFFKKIFLAKKMRDFFKN